MAKRNIRTVGDEILRKKSKEVTKYNKSLHTLLDDMAETMREADGVGIAAVQVGVLKRVVVIDIDEDYYEFINPVILNSEGSQISREGCLSVPQKNGEVERPEKISIKANDRDGNEFFLDAEGILAIVSSHEFDHLEGTLFIDKIIPEEELNEEEMP